MELTGQYGGFPGKREAILQTSCRPWITHRIVRIGKDFYLCTSSRRQCMHAGQAVIETQKEAMLTDGYFPASA